jgi:hypothetical protein
MKNYIKSIYILGAFALLSNMSWGYHFPGSNLSQGNNKPSASDGTGKSAGCAPATRKYTLDFNDVSALLEMGGVLFMDRAKNVSAYEVPKGGGVRAIFAAALWMGGRDGNGQLKLAAVRFRQGNDFWGGPLNVMNPPHSSVNFDPSLPVGDNTIRPFGDANIDAPECSRYDRFFPIDKATVIRFIIWWEACKDVNADPTACDLIDEQSKPTNEELAILEDWPAHGILGQQDYYLAPFYDKNDDGNYNIEDGDYPWFDDILGRDDVQCGIDRRVTLFGDRTIWFVFNDKGNIHTESQGDPIGMEIRAQAFSFATADEINRMTFYNYELINRSTQRLTNTFFSQYVDADLGFSGDDYVGCDVSRGLGYCYNGDAFDQTEQGQIGYGADPPAIGVDFFEGPYQDPDGRDNVGPVYNHLTQTWTTPTVADALADTGIVYSGIGTGYGDGIIDNERFGMRRFTYFTRPDMSQYPYIDPTVANQYYNFMQGFWADGSNTTYGGLGANGSILTDYMFPGDSDPLHWGTKGVDPGFQWTEEQAGNPFGDRRFVQSAGPFTLVPGAMNNITVGIVYGRAIGGGPMASVDIMKTADTKAQALFNACFKILDPPNAPKLEIQELENELILTISNPSTSNNFRERYEEVDDINIPITATDRSYNFEGYQIYQLKDESASVADIGDISKARQVVQCDLKNNIVHLNNYTLNEQYNILEGKRMVTAANQGVKHSFKMTTDAFALGDNRLINHKTYYFVAVAYAYNEYKKYDPNDPLYVDGQKITYISSRLSYDGTAIRSIPAIPHNPKPELGGTSQISNYGASPRITRLDGYGNGNRALELTTESREKIVTNGTLDKVQYDFGAGPINIKVVDPLNVSGGYYEILFRDYVASSGAAGTNSADTARWTIYQYSSEGGQLLDSVKSETTVAIDNEQLIPQWGVSIQVYQNKYTPGSGNATTNFVEPISASIYFADSSKRWLYPIPDDDAPRPTNWIVSGTAEAGTDNGNPPHINPLNYADEAGVDDKQMYEKLLGGGIAPHRVTRYRGGTAPSVPSMEFMPMAYSPSVASPTYSRGLASISYLPSVDIIITSDKSKWTRVPVIEMGRESTLTFGGALAGNRRKSPSVDKNGNPDGTGTGMGWFPGYAIDLETGARLHMAFGENSFLTQDGGRDMIWNPSSRIVDNQGNFVMAGVQPVWVFGVKSRTLNGQTSHLRDMRPYDPSNPGHFIDSCFTNLETSVGLAEMARVVYGNLAWIMYPMVAPGQQLLSTDVTIRLRVNKEYKNYVATNKNLGRPMYSWNMDELATRTGNKELLSEALDMINIVPNPYLAYSEYESNRLDTRIKITNLPDQCTIKIYSSSGKLIRTFKKDSPVTSIDWDLNNHARIPVSSGVYLVHVDVPDIGERVLKAFIGVRQVDLQGI